MNAPPTVARLERPTHEEFWELQRRSPQPVIITGVVDRWPVSQEWTPEYLNAEFGDVALPVWSIDPRFGMMSLEVAEMSLSNYIDEVRAHKEGGRLLYLGELPVQSFCPRVSEEFELPEYIDDERFVALFLYFGARVYSQLHYHPFGSAILCQIYGHKRIRLIAPDQTRNLYKYPTPSGHFNLSRMEEWHPDPQEFPRYSNVQPTEIVLAQGEMLFIPIHWWHGIQNEELNIAIAASWRRSMRSRWLPPRGMRADYFYEPVRRLLRRRAS